MNLSIIITAGLFLAFIIPVMLERWCEYEQRDRRYRDYMRHVNHPECYQQDPDEEIHLLFL